jgi:hypothetical protein
LGEGGDVEQRRQEQDQDELGVELDLGHTGDEPERQATQGQHDGVGDPEQAGQDVQSGDRHQQAEVEQF